MLKVGNDERVQLVQQPHHTIVSGYLAAHWGGGAFAAPGCHGAVQPREALREEVVLAAAEHDNGWWEEEAMPRFNDRDGLPMAIGEPATQSSDPYEDWRPNGFRRWRIGAERIATPHPYAALLMSLHAYWLYAPAFGDLMSAETEAYRHFVFGDEETVNRFAGDRTATRAFLEGEAQYQAELMARIGAEGELVAGLEAGVLSAQLRLVQLMDSLSLLLVRSGSEEVRLPEIPRAGWWDRVEIRWRWIGEGAIEMDPYPFDLDPLPVFMPVREVGREELRGMREERARLRLLHSIPLVTVGFEFRSRG